MDYLIDTHNTEFTEALLKWYELNKRKLPWRETKNPYYIWVSEVMLQQTRVDTVIPYYKHWIEKYPSIDAFAEAKEEDVLKTWEGLGYYRRVKNLHIAVKEVKEKYNSVVPFGVDYFRTLKGVGAYTAGAVQSIAYDIPTPAVDGNVMRVYARLCGLEDDIAKEKTRKKIEGIVAVTMSHTDPSSFNQALMELGATVCIPKTPRCELCPVQTVCVAKKEDRTLTLPVKSKAKANRMERYAVIVVYDNEGKVYLSQRSESGLLGGMWDFLMLPEGKPEQLIEAIEETFQAECVSLSEIGKKNHIFSHITWEMTAYICRINKIDDSFYAEKEMHQKPRSVAMQKIMSCLPETEE